MSANFSRSLVAALALSAATIAGRADANPTNDQVNAGEAGNPHSVDYANRQVPRAAGTNAELKELEAGNPHSVDYANRQAPRPSPTKAELSAVEAGNPHSVENAKSQR